jgi:CRP/FNR family transcriptional regulator, cyclic AMP receptor protein
VYASRPSARAGPATRNNDEVHEDSSSFLEKFLSRLPARAVAEFEQLGARRRFPAGSILFLEGDRAHEVFVITAGAVKISVSSAEGREVVLDVFEPGVFVGELAVIDQGPRSATVTALSPVEVITIAAGVFNEFLDRYPQALRLLLNEVIARLRTRVHHQLEFGTGDALGRVCALLIELGDRYGEPEAGMMIIRSPITQTELAAWTGLSREAVVKALRALRRLGWISNCGRAIVLRDAERVRHRAVH